MSVELQNLRLWEKRTHNLLDSEVSIYKTKIAISSNFRDYFDKYAEFLFDPENHVIAIHPMKEKTHDTYRVFDPTILDNRREVVKYIQIKSMLKELKIKRGRYSAEWSPEQQFLVFKYEVVEDADL